MADAKLKILLCITGLEVGGAEKLLCALADQYAAAGHEVKLVCLTEPIIVRPKNGTISLENLAMKRNPIGLLVGLWRLRDVVKSFQPDIVNSHLVHANILTRLLRLFTPMPRLVSSAHNTHEGGLFRMWAYRLTDRLADMSTNVSEEAVHAFEAQGAVEPGHMTAVYNGISTEEFRLDQAARIRIREELKITAETSLILAVGRLWEQKDYPSLLKAMSALKDDRSWRLAVAGDGPLRATLEALAADLEISERINWLGVRHDVPALMSACDVFVLSSACEGFGLVVAEAMACQRPVVATDCGGVREVIGNCGSLVPPKDPVALAEAIKSALAQPAQQNEELGRAARKRIQERYSIAATAERYLAVYKGKREFKASR